MSSMIETAVEYVRSGLSIIPIAADGSKAPAVSEWRQFQQNRANGPMIERWYGRSPQLGIAVIGGAVSGNLEILDFDDPAAYDEWAALMADYDTFDILSTIPMVRTPSGGVHLYYQCSAPIDGNKKLAYSADRKIRIETRGEGGYVVAPPSPLGCHPMGKDGKRYTMQRGDLTQIPTIDETERDVILAFARTLNLYVESSEVVGGSRPASAGGTASAGEKPGDDYNHRGDYEALLELHGWRRVRHSAGRTTWRRPGKEGRGISATSGYAGSRLFYVFSSNAAPFLAEKSYSPFGVYATLTHGGDYAAATKALGNDGFGAPFEPRQRVASRPVAPAPTHIAPVEDTDAETAMLGAMCTDRRVVSSVRKCVTSADLTAMDRRELFDVLVHLDDTRKPIDRVMVQNELQRRGKFGAESGQISGDKLASLFAFHGATVNAEHYAAIVAECAGRRRLSLMLSIHLAKSQSADCSIAEVRDSLISDIASVGKTSTDRGFKSLAEQANENASAYEERRKDPSRIIGVGSGLEAFDRRFGRFQPGNLIIVAARPSMGKTARLLHIVEHVAMKEGRPVALFSLEMSAAELVDRIVCAKAMISSQKLRENQLTSDEWDAFLEAKWKVSRYPIFINETSAITPEYLHSEMTQFMAHHGACGLIGVDYLQLMRSSKKTDNRVGEIGVISRGLKKVARDFHVPLIALSQLSRAVEQRENKRPMLSDLRESGDIEQDADMVIFLYRDAYYARKEGGESAVGSATIERVEEIVGKYRNGRVGMVNVGFVAEHAKFTNDANVDDPGPTGF